MVKQGKVKIYLDEYIFEILGDGDFFGESELLFGIPELFRIQAINLAEVYHIDSQVLHGIPIIHWKLYETYERRMRMIMNPEVSSIPIFKWREEYSTNVKAFDDTHKKLFEKANQLTFLLEYAEDHFAEEEQLMQKYGFPDLDNHRMKHEYLKKEVLQYKRRFDAGESMDDIDFIKFIKDWIVDHVLTEDRKYGPFLNQKGVF
jgi:hemerythrin